MSEFYAAVEGKPEPQGSIRSLGKGRPSVHSNAATLLPWRATVVHELRNEMRSHHYLEFPIDGAVEVRLDFRFQKPKSAPKSRVWPTVKPDVDKLTRAILDCLGANGAGLIRDDAQVVSVSANKSYGEPGCIVRLDRIEP